MDIDNRFVSGEKTSIPYANDQRIRIFSVFLFRNGDLERFPLAKTKRPVDLKLSVKVGLGRVRTLYSRSSKSSVQHILTQFICSRTVKTIFAANGWFMQRRSHIATELTEKVTLMMEVDLLWQCSYTVVATELECSV